MAEFYTVSHSNITNLSQLNLFGINNIDYQNEVKDILSVDDIKRKLTELYPNGISNHGLMYLSTQLPFYTDGNGRSWVHNTGHTESLFELVRQLKFPDRPSRFTSFFGCETVDEAKKFNEKYREGKGVIHKVSTQSYFKADMSLLLNGGSIIGGYKFAEMYWKGEAGSNPFWEILMSGPVKILECIDSLNDVTNGSHLTKTF